jgi:glucan 1,3-beta-glucosidase
MAKRESAARADTRPAFNRPPGARTTSAWAQADSYNNSEDESYSPPKRGSKEKAKSSPAPSPGRPKAGGAKRKTSAAVKPSPARAKHTSATSTGSASQALSVDSLAQLNQHNAKIKAKEQKEVKKSKEKQYGKLKEKPSATAQVKRKKRNRNVSGAILEEGRYDEKHGNRGGGGGHKGEVRRRRDGGGISKRTCWWIVGIIGLLLVIFIPVGIVLSNKKSSNSPNSETATNTNSDPANSDPANSNPTNTNSNPASSTPTNNCKGSDTPASAKGTYTDITTWMDTTDFNCTYTSETVGGLSVMGLYTDYDDSTQANENTPKLNEAWSYGSTPIRGVNLGGWLDLEPFITPSLFSYPTSDNVVDEWTLCEKLGSSAAYTLEQHYSTFVTQSTFQEIASAGLDHVRIPYPYWAVTTYPGDPYVPQIAWRYLLRAIEWARQSGLRVNLDLHSIPGSQNGWAHSGHQGVIGWLNGTDGTLNGQRALDIHKQLSTFFAQERYNNVITIYGLMNEPLMLELNYQSVLDWDTQAISIIRGNGIKQYISFGDGFLALTAWDDMFKGVDSKLIMDTHQYQVFNVDQLGLSPQNRIQLACSGWTGLITAALNPTTGWGPIMNGEFSQADTDCTEYLNDVGVGSRWAGTLNTGNASTEVLTPSCPSPPCSCDQANADPSTYTDVYKQYLQTYAEGQMYSFEQAWGWFYWTWQTENAPQWSYKLGLQAGILPSKAYSPDFTCTDTVPDLSGMSGSY